MRDRILYTILTAVCLLAIFIFSGQTATDSDAISMGMAVKILTLFTDYENVSVDEQWAMMLTYDEVIRSLAHFGIFLILGLFLTLLMVSMSCSRPGMRIYTLSWLLCVIYAVSDEVHQIFTDGRAFQLIDLLKDWSGSLLGVLIIWILLRKRGKQIR